MTTELTCLAWALVLAVIQLMAAAQARAAELGLRWNMSSRDGERPKLGPLASRLERAQANLFETLPLFAAAVLIATVAQRSGSLTAWGSILYLAARVLYVPIYAAGVQGVRSLVWLVSLAGLLMVIAGVLIG